MATAPLRKCMPVVAGTPVIDSPTAWVTTSRPSTVTRTMTAFRCACDMVSRTIFITASALARSVVAVGVGDPGGRAAGVQPVSMTSAQSTGKQRRMKGMTDLGRSGRARAAGLTIMLIRA